MTLGARSSLREVVAAVGDALRRHGIEAVLTGGACSSIHTAGRYLSHDLDFITRGRVSQAQLDLAMSSVGFRRFRDRYVHDRTSFFVEFPAGPLAIGSDHEIKPVLKAVLHRRVLMLSATDACRDRLAAFYHWRDVQSLTTAIQIAMRNRVGIARISAWSAREGHAKDFEVFRQMLRKQRRSS